MPLFSADERRKALEPWVFRHGYRRWEARPVSADLVVQAIEKLETAKTISEQRAVGNAIFRHAFPRNVAYLWRGDPVKILDQLPLLVWQETLRSFFDWALGRPHQSPPALLTLSSTRSSSAIPAGLTAAVPGSPSS